MHPTLIQVSENDRLDSDPIIRCTSAVSRNGKDGAKQLLHVVIREFNSATYHCLLADDLISHALEKRPCGQGDVGADAGLLGGCGYGFKLCENAAGYTLPLAIFAHVEHVYVAMLVQSAEPYEYAAFTNPGTALRGELFRHDIEKFVVVRSPGVYLFGRVVARVDGVHGCAEEKGGLACVFARERGNAPFFGVVVVFHETVWQSAALAFLEGE